MTEDIHMHSDLRYNRLGLQISRLSSELFATVQGLQTRIIRE